MQLAIGIGTTVCNGAPPSAVNAGPPQVVTEAESEATLAAVILDDGNDYDLEWTKLSGPGTVDFDDATVVDAVASFSEPGHYVLLLTADDGDHPPVKGAVSILVDAEPIVDAGEDQELEFSEDLTFDLAGSVTDNGPFTATWSKQSGPGDVTFGNASDPASEGNTVSEAGTYVLRLTADDGVNDPVFDEVTVEAAGDSELSAALASDGLSTTVTPLQDLHIVGTVDSSDFWSQFTFTVQCLGIPLPLTAAAITDGAPVFTHPLLPRDVVMTCTYAKGGDPDYWLLDGDENPIDEFSDLEVTTSGGPVDSTAPTLTYAFVTKPNDPGPYVLALGFDSWMDMVTLGAAGNLTLGGTAATLAGNITIAENFWPDDTGIAFVNYELAGTVYQGETVTLNHTVSGAPLQDLAGNDLANFTNMAVDNQSTEPGP